MTPVRSGYRPGDANLLVDGQRVTLRLTLGALAEIEDRLGGGDLAALTRRLEKTGVGDLLILLEALSAGGGRRLSVHELASADIDLPAAAHAVAKAFAALAPLPPSPASAGEGRRGPPPMIPWRQWLQFAVAGLNIDPETFWMLTVGEWRWLTEGAGADALTRTGLDALLALYPDERS